MSGWVSRTRCRTPARGPVDHCPQQRAARAAALPFGAYGQGPDLSLVRAGDDLTRLGLGLQHDRAENPLARAVHAVVDGHQDRPLPLGPEISQHRRVPRVR